MRHIAVSPPPPPYLESSVRLRTHAYTTVSRPYYTRRLLKPSNVQNKDAICMRGTSCTIIFVIPLITTKLPRITTRDPAISFSFIYIFTHHALHILPQAPSCRFIIPATLFIMLVAIKPFSPSRRLRSSHHGGCARILLRIWVI